MSCPLRENATVIARRYLSGLSRLRSLSCGRGSCLAPFLLLSLLYPLFAFPVSADERPMAVRPKTIVDLQLFRQTSSVSTETAGNARGQATLINLNPHVNAWYLLCLAKPGSALKVYHLENGESQSQWLNLESGAPTGIYITYEKSRSFCDLWGLAAINSLGQAGQRGLAYGPLCGGKLYLRNPVKGQQRALEQVTEFLREKVPGGEEIITSVRDYFFNYLYEKKAEEKPKEETVANLARGSAGGPVPALLDTKEARRLVQPTDLGIELLEKGSGGVTPGTWRAVKDSPDIYVSVVAPKWIAPELMNSYRNVVRGLDSVEAGGLVYLVAFDLERFDLKFALGTLHPQLGWSAHILPRMRDQSLPGPDGIDSAAPLVRTGLISPVDAARTVATFTGGFKRYHGAFKYGPLSLVNRGSHYGFIENGVVFSKLQPGLATLFALNDGRVEMKAWSEEDNRRLPEVRYARQNGVSLIADFDPVARLSVPGPLVGQWGPGNWSGSEKNELRAMRAGVGIQEFAGKRYLIYAFFWSATPSAMARVFQAYQVRHAMLLDMNALVHTYLAVYQKQGAHLNVGHLIKGMREADMTVKGRLAPRFLASADNRDFFYLTRKEAP